MEHLPTQAGSTIAYRRELEGGDLMLLEREFG
jgi:hypothetical protein